MSERDLAITFAGGGNRAFYQLGLMNVWHGRLLPRVGGVAACSAGACVAALVLSGKGTEVGEYWKWLTRDLKRNFEWRRLLSGRRPTPHEPLYRDLLLYAFASGGLERVRSQPFPFLVLTAGLPNRLPTLAATFLALCAYKLEQVARRGEIHPTYGRRLGFAALAFDARECETPAELADLIVASSATPPFTSVGRFAGRRLLDGGVVDNVPAFLADDLPGVRRNLVMLTRLYPPSLTGRRGSRLYLAPRQPLQVGRWDFTRPDLLEAAIAAGERDAREQESLLADFLS